MLLFLRRPLRIAIAYVCGAAVVGLGLAAVVVATLPDHSAREVVPNLVGVTIGMTRIAFIVGLVPSVIAIGLLEWRGNRRWWSYAVFGGCLAAVAAGFISGGLTSRGDVAGAATAIGGCAGLGAMAGWVYWCLAGRFAEGRRG